MERKGPIPDSYWLIDGQLLAGEYPGAPDDDDTRQKLCKFLDAGIRTFIDLTEAHEPLAKYDGLLRELARERGIEVRHVRHAIRDLDVPREREMNVILATIRAELDAGRPVYVHCWGGIGRTGTVAGCWLVEEGHTCDAALARIEELRHGTPDAYRRSPETERQREFIRRWSAGE